MDKRYDLNSDDEQYNATSKRKPKKKSRSKQILNETLETGDQEYEERPKSRQRTRKKNIAVLENEFSAAGGDILQGFYTRVDVTRIENMNSMINSE